MITEDQYTPPTSWCPSPERWHSTEDPESTETEVTGLVAAFVMAQQPDVVVETGTASAATAQEIALALKANNHGWLWTVEIDVDLAKAAREKLDGLPVTVANIDSLTWDPPAPIDFAWIDSGAGDVRATEIRKWRHLFRAGAVIGIHDTAPTMGRHVTRGLVEQISAEFGWPLITLRTPRGVSFLQVP